MSKKNEYHQYLKKTLGGLIDKLTVSDLRKEFLKNRWLDQLLWLEGKAKKEQKRYYTLRLITIVGGTLVPAMVGFNGFQGSSDNRLQTAAAYAAFGISQTVAISAAVEEFFAHGKKYRNYRNTAESLKIEGWQFFQLAGAYQQYSSHEAAYATFAQRVEQYIQQDIQGFLIQFEENKEQSTNDKEAARHNAQLAVQNLSAYSAETMPQPAHRSSEMPSPAYRSSEMPSSEMPSSEMPSSAYRSSEMPPPAYRSSEMPSSENFTPPEEFLTTDLPPADFLPGDYRPGDYQPPVTTLHYQGLPVIENPDQRNG